MSASWPSPFEPPAAELIVVIPARDEAASVAEVVSGVRAELGCEVLVVDDASRDGTAEHAAAAGASVLRLPRHLGAWGATQAGLHYARRARTPFVLTMDADGQHPPQAAAELYARFLDGDADLLIGSCPQRLSNAKRLAWAWFRLITQLDVRDFTSGLRVYGPRALRIACSRAASLLEYQDVGVLMLFARHGLRIEETPIAMQPRRHGGSRVFSSWRRVVRYMAETTVLSLAGLGRTVR